MSKALVRGGVDMVRCLAGGAVMAPSAGLRPRRSPHTARAAHQRRAGGPTASRREPASNQKVLTAAAALRELGPDYQFETILWANGPIEQPHGTLAGDLVLEGRGDPTLGSPSAGEAPTAQFELWAAELKAQGVRRVTGDLVVDDSFFDDRFVHPDWPARQHWRQYYAPVSALSLQDNCVVVTVEPALAAGERALVRLAPDVPSLRIANRCKTSRDRHTIWFDRNPGSHQIIVGGYVRHNSPGYSGKVTVPDPAMFAGEAFAVVLRDAGVRLEGTVRRVTAKDLEGRDGWRCLARRRTPLRRVLAVMLKHSRNMYAEQVLKTIGAEASGEGSWRGGLRRMAHMLESLHFEPGSLGVADGSGLSRNNRLSPALLCAVLADVERSGHGEMLRSLLAVAGQDGTLRRRLLEPSHKGRVQAKTGYLSGVGALSGYAETASGIRVAFSILINDFPQAGNNAAMKQIEDGIVRAIVDCAE